MTAYVSPVAGEIRRRPRRFVVYRQTVVLHVVSRGISRTLCDLLIGGTSTAQGESAWAFDEALPVSLPTPYETGAAPVTVAEINGRLRRLHFCDACRHHPSLWAAAA